MANFICLAYWPRSMSVLRAPEVRRTPDRQAPLSKLGSMARPAVKLFPAEEEDVEEEVLFEVDG